MNIRLPRLRSAFVLALLAGAPGLRAQSDRFTAPSFRGQTGALYAGWDDFTSATSANSPDRPGSAAGFTFTQLDPAAFITSSGNLYSFSTALSHRLDTPALAATPATIVLQTRTLGAAITASTVRLEYFDGTTWSALDAPLDELIFSETVGTGFGAALDETRRWTWTLGPVAATALRLSFQASGTSQSFQAAALDLSPATPADAHQTWLATHFSAAALADPLVSGPDADPDADGLPNLLEYALAGDPLDATSAPAPLPQLSGLGPQPSVLTFTFTRIADPELNYTVEASTDLADWVPVFISTGAANTAGPFTYTDDTAVDSAQPRRFLRLVVARP